MFGALKRGRFRSLASLILVVNVVGELQQNRTLAASRGFLAAARLSCTTYYCCFSNSYFDILLTAAVEWHVAAKVTEIVWRMQIKHRSWRQRDRRIWSLRKLKDKGPFPLMVVERRLRCILTCNVRGARRSFSSLLYQSLCLSVCLPARICRRSPHTSYAKTVYS